MTAVDLSLGMSFKVIIQSITTESSAMSKVDHEWPVDIVGGPESIARRQYVHICPICGTRHFVNEVRHRLAYGKHYCCSIDCEIKIRKAWRA